jgi:TRAP-type mannitol/chloroaromatic compound transport system substrate-binding protein
VKVAPYYYYLGFWEGSGQVDFYQNNKARDALSPELKTIVESTSARARMEMRPAQPGGAAASGVAGSQASPIPGRCDERGGEHAQAVYAEISQKNETFGKIYKDLASFRAEHKLWFRFTEATFDRFMQSQKL